jgi:hypothetical protein
MALEQPPSMSPCRSNASLIWVATSALGLPPQTTCIGAPQRLVLGEHSAAIDDYFRAGALISATQGLQLNAKSAHSRS